MLEESKWFYYNHALLPSTAPHEEVEIESLSMELKRNKKALFARWTSEFDCEDETEWWYCIKDSVFEVDTLDSKRRYCITRGKREFQVLVIDPMEYKKELYEIQVAAFSVYPEQYRPKVEKSEFYCEIDTWGENTIFGAFSNEDGKLVGYSLIEEHEKWAKFSVQKTNPIYEKRQINAALVAGICEHYNSRLKQGFYIVDGERNVSHITGFQGYLEKYFGFRKAYCKLNIRYRCWFSLLVGILYPMRKILTKISGIKGMHQVLAVLKMEEIRRSFRMSDTKE